MAEKTCFKCGRLQLLDNFYKHPTMADGHLGKCKQCTKIDVTENRTSKIDYYREYDRVRGNRQTKEYRDSNRARYSAAYRARELVARCIREKKLFRQVCEICGNQNTHAHHDDYAKPLNVRWLCVAHHSRWHKKYGEGKNKDMTIQSQRK